MRDIHPILERVTCYQDGSIISIRQCRACPYHEFDGAVAALGEYTFSYDTIMEVQSPYLCKLPED